MSSPDSVSETRPGRISPIVNRRGNTPVVGANGFPSNDETDDVLIEQNEKTKLLGPGQNRSSSITDYCSQINNDVIIKTGQSSDADSDRESELKSVSFGKLFRYATLCDRLLLVVGTFFALVQGAGWPALSVIFGQMTDQFVSVNTSGNGTAPDFGGKMTEYAIYYVYIAAAVFVASYIHCCCWMVACERQCHRMRKAFYQAILRQEIGWFDSHSSGELSTRLADDLERIREGIGDKFGVCIQFFSAFISGFAIGFWKGWNLTLVMMSLTPVLAILSAFMGYTISTLAKKEQNAYAGAGTVAEEVLSCIRTVVSFCGQQKEVARYEAAVKSTCDLGVKKALVTGFGMGFFMIALFGAYALAFWYGSTQVLVWQESLMVNGISPGSVFTVFFCVMIGSFSIGNAAPHISNVATAKAAAAFIYNVIDRVPSIDASDNGGLVPSKCEGSIELQYVDFYYPTRPDVQIMKEFSMRIDPGKTVALVGSSGCGKTTVINLILRFYDPKLGRVLVDGVDIKNLNLGWLRDQIGVVSQEPILFGCSIEENIMYGRANVTQAEVILAAKSANAHSFITQLPDGYNTLVGERGVQLSGGQKQRVAIARALVRNPRILLLDEATSALDSGTENVVQEALDLARQGRTTIVVAHRLSTIKNADVIYAVDQGAVSEVGTHNELMERKGVYFQLVTLQTFVKDADEEDLEAALDDKNPRVKRALSVHELRRQASKKDVTDIEGDDVKKESFGRMIRLNAAEWPLILSGSLASMVLGVAMPVFAVFFSKIIEVFAETGDDLRRDAVFWSLMFVALGGAQFLAQFVYIVMFGMSGERLTMRLRVMTFRNILRQDLAWFDQKEHSSGALTTRLATDATLVKTGAGIRIGVIIQSCVSMIAGLAISVVFGWKLALLVLALAPIMAVAGSLHMRTVKGNQQRDSKLMEEAGKTACESIENIRTVQSLGLETRLYIRYCQLLEAPYRENVRQAFIFSLSFAFSQAVIFLIYAGAFRFGAYLVEIGDMLPENVYRVFFAIAFSGMAIGQATSLLPDYAKAQLGAGHIYQLLDAVPAIDSYSQNGNTLDQLEGDITFEKVEFVYPSRPAVKVLQGLNLKVKPGSTLALVGASGCGKSTMVSLLQRFYDPKQGRICIDGVDIRSLKPSWLRSAMSVVSQEPVLFDTTIAKNIAYGIQGEAFIGDIIKAAKLAAIHDYVMTLPDEYETMVGEKGTQLSGGQKQRIAIARALVTNPKILLLDEATSALDSESEKVVQSALDQARLGRTCIIIAHRLSTVQTADTIAVIEQGKVVEQGTHHQLLQARGAYYSLTSGQRNILT